MKCFRYCLVRVAVIRTRRKKVFMFISNTCKCLHLVIVTCLFHIDLLIDEYYTVNVYYFCNKVQSWMLRVRELYGRKLFLGSKILILKSFDAQLSVQLNPNPSTPFFYLKSRRWNCHRQKRSTFFLVWLLFHYIIKMFFFVVVDKMIAAARAVFLWTLYLFLCNK